MSEIGAAMTTFGGDYFGASRTRIGLVIFGHRVRQLVDGAVFGGEVELSFRLLDAVTGGPEGVEIVWAMRSADVAVISGATCGQLIDFAPRCPLVVAGPDGHFAAGAPFLRTTFGRRNDAIGAVFFDVQ